MKEIKYAQASNQPEIPASEGNPASSHVSATATIFDRAIERAPIKESNVSSRKIEANRKNSRRSTGPRTAAGKERVSRNAIKHGFYAKWLIIPHPDGKESPREYDDCYAKIFKDYQPVGWREERCVETIAVWSWRLRRVIRHESGQIARALAAHANDLQQSRAVAEELDAVPSTSPEMDKITDHLFLTSEGLEEQMRYEALLNRQLNHALAELQRLQERRKGGPTVA